MAAFFAVTSGVYGRYGHDPAGTSVLIVACLMAAVVAFFLAVQYRRRGRRAQDRRDAEVVETAGPLDFFPPSGPWPIVVAAGGTVVALGVVFGAWLALLGVGVLAFGVFELVFEHVGRYDDSGEPPAGRSGG
ncbi:aa3-type cytochrome oxidase subunit IV [Streptomyces niger]|uniref:aa3-type cytochrome oxidase subunit IV n=1 Tax=Streptomyces niger TaxID=66373 RepID=UPI001F2E3007|nr:cytochrome c oxidase subunit 4 [Streptomyces niger]